MRRQTVAQSQRGAATLLVMLLLGIGMIATSAGVINSQRSTQERQIASHAQTHAQSAAWAGANALRTYLGSLESPALKALPVNQQWPIDLGSATELTAWVTQVETLASDTAPGEDAYRISARIRALDPAARASSTLEVVYSVTPGSGQQGITLDASIDFGSSLTITGDINFFPPAGESFDLRVDGDVTVGSASVSGIGRLAATGDITLGSSVTADEVFANGDVTITGGAQPGLIYALGTVTMSGGTGVDQIYANEGVVLRGGTVSESVDTLGDITVNAGGTNQGTLTAGGKIDFISATSAQAARAIGDVNKTGGGTIGEIVSHANVNCSQDWLKFPSIRAGGDINCAKVTDRSANMAPPPPIDLMTELQPLNMNATRVDVWAVREQANYIFEPEGGRMRVTVQHINGLADGVYYLGTFGNNSREYLCREVDNNNNCLDPANLADARTICGGQSADNRCFNYSPDNQRWTIDGKNMAPGAAWFDGDLRLANGHYYNTFMATGNISTSGSLVVEAINYIGATAICQNEFPQNKLDEFEGLYPTNFCTAAGDLKANPLGNIAFMTGGYRPDTDPPEFSGGLVALGSDNQINGTVLAGDVLETGGSSTIRGYVSAAGWGLQDKNVVGASTKIDLRELPDTYNPLEIPDMSGTSSGDDGEVTVTWSRYL